MVKKTRKKGTTVDFEGVEAGGMAVADGRYLAYPESVELTEAESSGNEMFKVKWKIVGPKSKGGIVWDNMVLLPQTLWRLKGMLETMGIDVPDGSMDIDPADLEGEENTIGIEVTNEDYRGKPQARITGFLAADDVDEEAEPEAEAEEEEEKPKRGKVKPSKKSAKEDEPEEDEPEEEEEEEKTKKPKKVDKKVGKGPKIKEGVKVTFNDEKGKTIRGTVTEVDGETVKVTDRNEEEWELDISDLELA